MPPHLDMRKAPTILYYIKWMANDHDVLLLHQGHFTQKNLQSSIKYIPRPIGYDHITQHLKNLKIGKEEAELIIDEFIHLPDLGFIGVQHIP